VIAAMAGHCIDAAPMLPWYFPTLEDYRGRLTARGFEVAMIELIDRPTTLPGDIGDWLETFVEPILLALDAPDRPKVVEQVRRSLRADLYKPGTGWVADYVRLRFKAIKPAGAER